MNRHLRKYIEVLNRVRPQLTDVSLRDGIQSAAVSEFPTQRKKEILHNIMTQYVPARIEVGSFVSPKVLPIMADTNELYQYGAQWSGNREQEDTTKSAMVPMLGVLVPNMRGLNMAVDNGVKYMSFITSVSEDFQLKNTRKSLFDTKTELHEMTAAARQSMPDTYLKLYISCISKCPLRGELDSSHIVSELMCYSSFDFDELCLSDTCGTLKLINFKNIVSTIINYGVPVSKLSVHLHVLPDNEDNVVEILKYCFEHGINKFDVSLLEQGGCSVTMGKDTKPNLSYDLFYRALNLYIKSMLSNDNLEQT